MLLNYACFCFPTIFFVVVWLKEWDRCQKEGEYIYVPPQTSRKQLSWVLSEGKPEGRVSHQPLPSDGAPTGNSHPSFLMGVTTNVADSFTAIFQLRIEAMTWTDRTEFSLFFWEKKSYFLPDAWTMYSPATCVRPATGCNIGLKAVEIYLLTLSIVHHPRSHARASPRAALLRNSPLTCVRRKKIKA